MAIAENANVMSFGTGTAGDDATEFGFWSALTGGTFYGSTAILNNPRALAATEAYQFAAGSLRLRFPRGRFQEAYALRVAAAAIAETMYVSVHSAAAGNTGANEIAGTARIPMAALNMTISAES